MMTTIDSTTVPVLALPLAMAAPGRWWSTYRIGLDLSSMWRVACRPIKGFINSLPHTTRTEVCFFGVVLGSSYLFYRFVAHCDWTVPARWAWAHATRMLKLRHFRNGALPPGAVAGDDAVSGGRVMHRSEPSLMPLAMPAVRLVAADDTVRLDAALSLQRSSVLPAAAAALPLTPEATVVAIDRRSVVAAGLAHVDLTSRKGFDFAVSRDWSTTPAFWWTVYLRFKVTRYGQLMKGDATRADKLACHRALVDFIEALRVEPSHTAIWLPRVWALLLNDAALDLSLRQFLRLDA